MAKAECRTCAYYAARPPKLMRRCQKPGVCIKTAEAVEPGWTAALMPCAVNGRAYWEPAGEVSDALQRWAGTFDGHVVLTAAERCAWGRRTGGADMTLEAIAKLIPYAGKNTACVIANDIEGPCGDGADLAAMTKDQRGLYIACKERLGEIDDLR